MPCPARPDGDEKFQRVNAINLWKANAWLLIEFFGIDPAIDHMVGIELGKAI